MREAEYQRGLIGRLEHRFPGCVIQVANPQRRQGTLDLTILFPGGFWATLECKRSRNAPFRPNQEYYVEQWGELSFAAVIFPENEAEVLDALQQAFESRRAACLS